MLSTEGFSLRPNQLAFLERFVAACTSDDRIVAAFLGGSNVKGYADQFSDLDLSLITIESAFDDFCAQRETFLNSLGELVFL